MVAAAGAGAALVFLGRVFAGVNWIAAEPMIRERLFVGGLDTILIAVLVGLLALLIAHGNPSRAFLLGVVCATSIGSWIGFGIAAVLVAAAWKFMPLPPAKLVWVGGAVAFALAPIVWLLPPNRDLMPIQVRPVMAPLAADVVTPAPGSPDVVLIVCDTLRADAILNPHVTTPNLDALRASGTWSQGAVAPSNQTLPSHLSLLFALDIENVGMRSNRSRWPSRKILVEQRNAQSLAERFGAAGYRTQAVVSNKILSSAKPGKTDEDNQWMGEGFHSWYDVSRQPSTQDFLQWVEHNSLIGALAAHQIVLKKRALNFSLRRILIPVSANHFRLHYQEGETTVTEVQRSLEELTMDDRPYFLFANFMEPHAPYLPPPAYANTLAVAADRPAEFSASFQDELRMRHQAHRGSLQLDKSITEDIYLPTARYLHNLYREEVAYFDALLGRTIDSIRATGRPTVILFVGDHGEGFGEHNDPEHGHTLFESEISVPFILNGVGVPAGVELPFTPELVDGAFTLLELAGLVTSAADGRNVLSPSFQQGYTLSFRNGQVATFDGRWKLHADFQYDNDTLSARAEGKRVVRNEYQLTPLWLFDLSVDPGETNNLLDSQPLEAERLLAAIRKRLEHDIYPELKVRVFSFEENLDLDELGYIGEELTPSSSFNQDGAQ